MLATAPGTRLVHEPDNDINDGFALLAKIGLGRHPTVSADEAPERYRELWREAFEHGGTVDTRTARAIDAARARIPREVLDGIMAGTPDRRGRVAQAVLERFAQPRCAGGSEGVRIVKSVHAAFVTDVVRSVADPHVLVIRRNPLNVLSSWIDFGWEPQGFEDDPRMVDLAGLADVTPFPDPTDDQRRAASYAVLHRRFDRLLAEHPDWVAADHDDLCDAPHDRFEELFGRLDLTWTDATVAAIDEANTPGTGYDTRRLASEQRHRWRARLSDEQVESIVDVLEHYGVGTQEVFNI